MLTTVLLTLICYIIGSLMFSYWLGRIKGVDIRMYGDGNPGAINAFKAGGWLIGTLGLSLDYLKGFLPVLFVTRALRINDWRLVPIAVAPVFGHAFSPFLKFRGGKSIATTFGIWSGLTLWECPTLLGIVFIFLKFVVRIKQDAWVVLIGMSGVLIYILFRLPRLELFLILGFNTLILVIKHWHDLLIRL